MQLRFTRENGPADQVIDQLMNLVGEIRRPEIVRQMIIAALKAGQEDDGRVDLKMINSTLKEMRFTAKAFAPYREIRKITVFGSARTREDEPAYQLAREFGERVARAGYMVITGAGPGIMQAANEGAGPEHSFGVNIRLPFEQKSNAVFEGNPRLITYKYFFNRKVAFIKEADAVVLFPGGFGTLDEAMETLTLLQTGKRYSLPLVLVDEPGSTYWAHVIRFFEEELLERGYIGRPDLNLFEHVQSVDEALQCIDRFYRRYHSLRYVGARLVIRLKNDIDGRRVDKLKEDFADIMTPGGEMFLSGAFEEELDEPEIAHLPRLVMDFNRLDFGRLRQFIEALNEA